jgi:predicted nucleotidyltransferase
VLPGAWVYLTGSAALGDWLPGHSDLDILVVTGSAPARSWRAGRGVRTIGLMGFT